MKYCGRCGRELVVSGHRTIERYDVNTGEACFRSPKVYCPARMCRFKDFLADKHYWVDTDGVIQCKFPIPSSYPNLPGE